ncbi:NADP-dependent oxidoreductase [Hyphomicrobium sp.]|uniref:NADP-dependent oxidoreductase n=1 Tax=Hyphomicrobium sp. TaxID=82 RepID=UPI000FA7B16D|nr:NADP-dependent oxidoreductase [Hyphomicrobium sp.]RUP11171.1 MAG: NADP-dependent oxidoreductase [Hyphomicrobium sp.]
MKANRVHAFGPPNVISFEDVAVPEPGPGEVLVHVQASGVGPWDAWIRSGVSKVEQKLPITLGSDLSGIVTAVGGEVKEFKPGDHVFGVTNPQFTGANAEYAVAQASMIASKPRRLGFIESASVPVVAVTAWQMLFDYAGVKNGQRVLILGGAGNVGAYAVQLARRAGAYAVATASESDADYVYSLDADEVVFYSGGIEEGMEKFDAVIDTVGGDIQRQAIDFVSPGGILVSAVSRPDEEEARRRGVRCLFFLVEVTTARLSELAAILDAGEIETNIGTMLPLAEARTAHEMLDGMRSRPRGKIVLRHDT